MKFIYFYIYVSVFFLHLKIYKWSGSVGVCACVDYYHPIFIHIKNSMKKEEKKFFGIHYYAEKDRENERNEWNMDTLNYEKRNVIMNKTLI